MSMGPSEFLGINVIALGALVLVVVVYLIVLIRKRRQQKFLHKDS
jgi:hypothetical protein